MMGYDIKTVELTYTDRKVLREAADEVLANPKSTVIKSVLRNAANKLRWAEGAGKHRHDYEPCTCGLPCSPNEIPPRDPWCPIHGKIPARQRSDG
jgi:hypothetical protein